MSEPVAGEAWTDTVEQLADARKEIRDLEAQLATVTVQRDRLQRWQEFVRYNTKDAAHRADEALAAVEER